MAAGLDEYYLAQDGAAAGAQALPTRLRPLPQRQARPYVQSLIALQNAGLITPKLAQATMVTELQRASYQGSPVPLRGTAFQGQANLTDEERAQFQRVGRNRVRRGDNDSVFVPRDETESSGFLRLLELFQVFNYAIAGAVDATVNLIQGETEETNPFLEAWRGFTLQDKQTFSDVFDNMGWDSQDGVGKWSREVLGFAADVIFDPTTYLTLGTGAVAARAAGRAAGSATLKVGKVAFAGGTRQTPLRVLDEIATKLSDEATAAARLGLDEVKDLPTNARDRVRALADLFERKKADTGISDALLKETPDELLEAQQKFAIQGAMRKDVEVTFDRLIRERGHDTWDSALRRADGDIDTALATFGVDPHIARTVFEDLMGRDGIDYTFDNLKKYISGPREAARTGDIPLKATVQKMLDQGGLKLKVPFGPEFGIRAQWMDATKFKMMEAASDSWRFLVNDSPAPIQAITKFLQNKVAFVFEAVSNGAEMVKHAFGATLGRSPWLREMFKDRAVAMAREATTILEETKKILTIKDGSKTGRALTEVEQDVLFDAMTAEEDAATLWRRGGKKFFSDKAGESYQETKLGSIILGDARLDHLAVETREQIVEMARNTQELFNREWDLLAEEGLDVAFLDYYLPSQFEGYEKTLNVSLRQGKFARFSDDDPFIRSRNMTRSEATRPRDQGGFGLKPVKNVFGLIYNRRLTAERARIERLFVSRLQDGFAVHPRQVHKLLEAEYGPRGKFGTDILRSIERKTLGPEVWRSQVLLKNLPQFEELLGRVQRGEWESATDWLEQNPDVLNIALIHGEDSLDAAIIQDIDAGRATIHEMMNQVADEYTAIVERAREKLGVDTPDGLIQKIKQFVGKSPEGDLEFASELSSRLVARVSELFGRAGEAGTARGLVLPSKVGPQFFKAADQGGESAARMVILESVLEDVGTKGLQLGDEVDGLVEEWAQELFAMMKNRQGNELVQSVTSRWDGFDFEMATMFARFLPVQMIEDTITKGGRLLSADIGNSAFIRKLKEYTSLKTAGKGDEARAVLDVISSDYGRTGWLAKQAEDYRRSRGLPVIPFGKFTREARGELFEFIAKKQETGAELGLKFFSESPYVASGGAKSAELRKSVSSRVAKSVRAFAKDDNALFGTLMDIINTPAAFRSGANWNVLEGVNGLVQTSYGGRASGFYSAFKDAATAADPAKVIKKMRSEKLIGDSLTRSVMDSPSVIRDAEEGIIRAMTARVKSVAARAAEVSGRRPEDFRALVSDFQAAVDTSRARRGYSEVDTTEAHELLQDAVNEFDDGIRELLQDPEANEIMAGLSRDFSDEIIASNQKIAELFRDSKALTREMLTVTGSVKAITEATPEQIAGVLEGIEELTDSVRALSASVEARVEKLLKPLPESGAGRELALEWLKDDPIVGSFLKLWDDLRGDLNKMPKEVEAAFVKRKLELGTAQAKTAEDAIKLLDQEMTQIQAPIEALQEQVRILDRMSDNTGGIADRYAARLGPQPEWTAESQRDVLADWLQVAATDEFLRLGGVNELDWAQAVEKVWASGPTNKALRGPWEKHLKGVRPDDAEEVLQEVRRAMSSSPLDSGDVASHRALRQLNFGIEPPDQAAIQQAAIDVMEEFPLLAREIALDEVFMSDVAAKAADLASGRDPRTFIEALGAEALLPAADVQAVTQRVVEEAAWLEAFQLTARERLARLERLGLQTNFGDVTKELQQSILESGALGPVATSLSDVAAQQEQAARAAAQMVEASLRGEPLPPGFGLDELADQVELAVGRLREGGLSRDMQRFLSRLEETVQSEYEKLGVQLGDPNEILEGVAGSANGDLLQRFSRGELSPQEIESYEAFLDVFRPGKARGQYWIWRLGVRGKRPGLTGNVGLAAGSSVDLAESLGRYSGSEAFSKLRASRTTAVQGQTVDLIQQHTDLIETRAFARKELELFNNLVLPDLRRKKALNLGFGPGETERWHSMAQMHNYYKMQVLAAEHDGLVQILASLPSASEVRFLRARAELVRGGAIEDIEALQRAKLVGGEIGGGRVFDDNAASLAEKMGVIQWEGTGEEWSRILSTSARQVNARLGVDLAGAGTDQRALEILSDAGVVGIERISPEGGEILFVIPEGTVLSHPSLGTTLEQIELNDAVQEIVGHLNSAEVLSKNLLGAPALESQVKGITEQLRGITKDPVEQGSLIFALTGRSRLDQLNAIEAAQVMEYLGQKAYPDVRAFGSGVQKQLTPPELALGAFARGHLPLHADQGIEGAEKALEKVAGTKDELVRVRFHKFEGAVSPDGVPLEKEFFVPAWAGRLINDLIVQDNVIVGPAKAMLKPFDWFTNSFKWLQTAPWPAFHLRNVLDGAVRMMMAIGLKGMNVSRNWDIVQLMKGADGTMLINGVEHERKFLLDVFKRHGGIVDFGEKIGLTQINVAGVTDPRLSPWNANFALRGVNAAKEVANNLGGKADNYFRLNIFIEGMERGMAAPEAMRFAQKYMFDYAHALTPFERQAMRRMFPFYTFARFNIPLMLETMYQRPGLISGLGKTQQLLRDDESPIEELIPGFVREGWQFFPQIKNGKMQVWRGANLIAAEDLSFIGDLTRWRTGGFREGTMKELIGRLNPLAKLPFELAAGKDFFFNRDIVEDSDVRKIILDVPVVREFLQLRQVQVGDETMYRVNGYRYHLLNQTQLGRLYRTASESFGKEMGLDERTAWERLVPFVTGLRLTSIDLDRRYNQLITRAGRNREAIERAIAQGDAVKARRLLGTTERNDEDEGRVAESMTALRALSEVQRGRSR